MKEKLKVEAGTTTAKEIIEHSLYAIHQDVEDIDNVRTELFFDGENNLNVMISADVEIETEVDGEETKWVEVIVNCYKGTVELVFEP